MNKTFTFLALVLTCLVMSIPAQAQQMNEKRVERFFKKLELETEGEDGVWMVNFEDRWILVFADEDSDRMRIFTPVVNREEIDHSEWERMLEANFHTALDAKYGLYNEYVIALFSHPLSYLDEYQLEDAMNQVVNLADTFGTSYASSSILFGKPAHSFYREQPDEKNLRINQRPGGDVRN